MGLTRETPRVRRTLGIFAIAGIFGAFVLFMSGLYIIENARGEEAYTMSLTLFLSAIFYAAFSFMVGWLVFRKSKS